MKTRRIKLKRQREVCGVKLERAVAIVCGVLLATAGIQLYSQLYTMGETVRRVRDELQTISINYIVEMPDSTSKRDLTPSFVSVSETWTDIPIEIQEIKQEPCSSKIDRFLDSYPNHPWKGRGQQFVDAITKVAGREDCDATRWMVAIGCKETSCGRNAVKFNGWGLRCINKIKGFEHIGCSKFSFSTYENWEQAIETYAKWGYDRYLKHNDAKVYAGRYCVDTTQSNNVCQGWQPQVTNFLNKML